MSYFGAKYSLGEAGGNQSIPGQNMWPFPLCDHTTDLITATGAAVAVATLQQGSGG